MLQTIFIMTKKLEEKYEHESKKHIIGQTIQKESEKLELINDK